MTASSNGRYVNSRQGSRADLQNKEIAAAVNTYGASREPPLPSLGQLWSDQSLAAMLPVVFGICRTCVTTSEGGRFRREGDRCIIRHCGCYQPQLLGAWVDYAKQGLDARGRPPDQSLDSDCVQCGLAPEICVPRRP